MLNYITLLLTSLSRALNFLLGGEINQTLSSRVGYMAVYADWQWVLARRVINGLFFWQKDHCKTAMEWDNKLNGVGK